MKKEVIQIQNLKCGGCANTIIKNLTKIEGVSEVVVDNESSSVSFLLQDIEVIDLIKNKLKALGYPNVNDENTVVSKAKSFVSCATGRISK